MILAPGGAVGVLRAGRLDSAPAMAALKLILAEPALSLRLYGKLATRPGRKMGHVARVAEEGA
ncbi:MAG: hypothetical protein ABR878_13155 [Roseiarcus sp.]|jgi:phosphoribosylaminoimidazole carboxylase (NCAIR synthetase)